MENKCDIMNMSEKEIFDYFTNIEGLDSIEIFKKICRVSEAYSVLQVQLLGLESQMNVSNAKLALSPDDSTSIEEKKKIINGKIASLKNIANILVNKREEVRNQEKAVLEAKLKEEELRLQKKPNNKAIRGFLGRLFNKREKNGFIGLNDKLLNNKNKKMARNR